MTARARILLIAAACSLGGLAVGYQAGRLLTLREMAEIVDGMRELGKFDIELEAEGHLRNIELTQGGKPDSLVSINCSLLRLKIRGIDAATYGNRADDVRKFLERARAKIGELDKNDLCGRKPAS